MHWLAAKKVFFLSRGPAQRQRAAAASAASAPSHHQHHHHERGWQTMAGPGWACVQSTPWWRSAEHGCCSRAGLPCRSGPSALLAPAPPPLFALLSPVSPAHADAPPQCWLDGGHQRRLADDGYVMDAPARCCALRTYTAHRTYTYTYTHTTTLYTTHRPACLPAHPPARCPAAPRGSVPLLHSLGVRKAEAEADVGRAWVGTYR